jgi:hypothetical protein
MLQEVRTKEREHKNRKMKAMCNEELPVAATKSAH